jgi:hypothetical protein
MEMKKESLLIHAVILLSNGEDIYGSKMYSSYNDGDSIRYTSSKDGSVKYIFLFKFPTGTIQLSKIGFTKKTKPKMLGSNSKLSWKQNENAVAIAVPASLQSVTNHVWVIKVEQ